MTSPKPPTPNHTVVMGKEYYLAGAGLIWLAKRKGYGDDPTAPWRLIADLERDVDSVGLSLDELEYASWYSWGRADRRRKVRAAKRAR